MKTKISLWMFAAAIFLVVNTLAHGQGTVTFDASVPGLYRNYYEAGMWFRVITPPPNPPYRYMALPVSGSAPSNGTQHMEWHNDGGPEYVAFSMTDGSAFGVTSIDLGNFGSTGVPSIAITFNGFRTDESMVSITFNTPLNNFTTFTTFNFGAAFGSGLTRIEIPSQYWAMDNVVIVPEPSTFALLGMGLLALAAGKLKQHGRF